MSFFSGFSVVKYDDVKNNNLNYNLGRRINIEKIYQASFSEAMGTISNISIAIISLCSAIIVGVFGKNKKVAVLGVLFLILSIAALVVYYIKKNEIIKVYEENADKTLNIIYFSGSIGIAFILIILLKLL